MKIEFPKQVFCQFAILFRDLTRTKPRTITGTMGINNDGVDCYHQVDGEKVVLTVENDVTSEVGIYEDYGYLRAYKIFNNEDDLYKFFDDFECKHSTYTYGDFTFTFKVVDYLMHNNEIKEVNRLRHAGVKDEDRLRWAKRAEEETYFEEDDYDW